MFDLDGVIYIGPDVVDGAAEALERVRTGGVHIAFVTNNASRTPEAVAAKLTKMGVHAEAGDVVTSAQAAATVLSEMLPQGAQVFMLGSQGLEQALTDVGLSPTRDRSVTPAAVVSGYGPDTLWSDIMVAAVMIRNGIPYVATNGDMTIPTDYGIGPGHGVLVRTLTDFAGVTPRVAGKPERPLFDETIRRVGGERPLMVGDRLDTDIEGANVAGGDSLLVMTGVTGLEELAAATPVLRPTYVDATLEGLFRTHTAPEAVGDGWHCAGWTARADSGALSVTGSGSVGDWYAAVAAAAWAALDTEGTPLDVSGLTPPSGSVES